MKTAAGIRTHERGYSLPELLIVIALIGIFVVFGGPIMGDTLRAYQARSQANDLTTITRALRYNAVTNRAPVTLTLNDENDGTSPNSYEYVNIKGKNISIGLQNAVVMEAATVATITFGINGSTGQTGNQDIIISRRINKDRGDRYTISVTATGTVRSTYTTYTP